jgi:hypothetical protein
MRNLVDRLAERVGAGAKQSLTSGIDAGLIDVNYFCTAGKFNCR